MHSLFIILLSYFNLNYEIKSHVYVPLTPAHRKLLVVTRSSDPHNADNALRVKPYAARMSLRPTT